VVDKIEFSPDSRMLLTNSEFDEIRLLAMDTETLEELQKEHYDLTKMPTEHLHHGLTEHDIDFDSEDTNVVALVDRLVTVLNRSQRKDIILRWKTSDPV
jgi:hypothetical protein